MTHNRPDIAQNETFISARMARMRTVFYRAYAELQEADALLWQARAIDDPDDPKRVQLDERMFERLREADRLIDVLRGDLPFDLDSIIAFHALVIAVSDPYDACADDNVHRALAAGVEAWLAATPETELRQQIEYLVNRPHVLNAEMRRDWDPSAENLSP